jgi:hypothetical protein
MGKYHPPGSAMTVEGHVPCSECRHERHKHLRLGAGACTGVIYLVVMADGQRQPDKPARCQCPMWRAQPQLFGEGVS